MTLQFPKIPNDRPTWESPIAWYWFSDEGYLVSLSKPVKRTVELIQKNAACAQEITGGVPVPLLIYLSPSPMPDKATRQFSTKMVPVLYSAMALVSRPGLSSFIMKLLFRFQKPPIPMMGFTDDRAALVWLKSITKGSGLNH